MNSLPVHMRTAKHVQTANPKKKVPSVLWVVPWISCVSRETVVVVTVNTRTWCSRPLPGVSTPTHPHLHPHTSTCIQHMMERRKEYTVRTVRQCPIGNVPCTICRSPYTLMYVHPPRWRRRRAIGSMYCVLCTTAVQYVRYVVIEYDSNRLSSFGLVRACDAVMALLRAPASDKGR